jgi:sporulation protein YlmC with PRC-barrel domain
MRIRHARTFRLRLAGRIGATLAVAASALVFATLARVEAQQPAPQTAAPAAGPLVDSSSLIGSTVRNAEGKDVGRIDRLMIDPATGRVTYAVIVVGSTLGMGGKNVALPWANVRLTQANDQSLIVVVEQQVLDRAPSDRRDQTPAASPPTTPGTPAPSGTPPRQ